MANLYLEIEEAKDEAEERERGVRAAHRTIAQMLQCIQQGLLTLDGDLRIQPEYSAHLEDIVATTDLAGKDFLQLVFGRSNLATDAARMAEGALRMVFGHEAFLFELNAHALPLELIWESPAGAKLTLELEYSVIANAIDHGIEDAQTRTRAGKPAAGRIDVQARTVDGYLVLSITDDGAGVDLVALRQKLATPQEPDGAHMSDHEVAETIFTSGTSTAAKVTQVSGRGVGMAWLKRETERLGGWAQLQPSEEQPCVDRLLFRVEIGLPLPGRRGRRGPPPKRRQRIGNQRAPLRKEALRAAESTTRRVAGCVRVGLRVWASLR